MTPCFHVGPCTAACLKDYPYAQEFYQFLMGRGLGHSAPKGWQCPVCGAVYSPKYPACDNCRGKPK